MAKKFFGDVEMVGVIGGPLTIIIDNLPDEYPDKKADLLHCIGR